MHLQLLRSRPPHNSHVLRAEGSIPFRDKGRAIRVRWYRPNSVPPDEPLPVLINFHGSGFILPFFGQDEEWCATVAERVGCLVVDADYRKAPEHPYPLGSEDAEDVALHIFAQNSARARPVCFSGCSAGGNLALSLTALLGPERISAVVAFYPSIDIFTDIAAVPPSIHMKSGVPLLHALMRHFIRCYVLPGTARTDLRLSPTFAWTEDMPPHVFVATGTADPLYAAAERFMSRLNREGHLDAVFSSVEDAGHGFVMNSTPGKEAFSDAINFLRKSVE
ncbi:Alpha/Beta hydrolase protein [Mycena rosella]|uniref:Alpha/Beta hydrolase protein n=1 Tax=Mycena rosella TaxID=1033263 RepID=A0AAD7DMA8_MYCRO|nr:Alpha/Beta hydrolase protein [Mycena rosella]